MDEMRRMLMAVLGGVIPVPIESENVTITKETISFNADTDFFYWWKNNLVLQKGITLVIDSRLLARQSGYPYATGMFAYAMLRWDGRSQSGQYNYGDGRPGYAINALQTDIRSCPSGYFAYTGSTTMCPSNAVRFHYGINTDGTVSFGNEPQSTVQYNKTDYPYFIANNNYYIIRIPSNLVY